MTTLYKWEESRRATSCRQHSTATRPAQLCCTHDADDRGGQVRARTRSMPTADTGGREAARRCVRLHHTRHVDNNRHSPTEYVRVRSFSTSSRGVKNRGDSLKRRQLRHTSLADSDDVNHATGHSVTQTDDVSRTASAVSAAAEFTVVVVGDGGVGKRSIISQFTTSEYMHGSSPTAPGELTLFCSSCSCCCLLDTGRHSSLVSEYEVSQRDAKAFDALNCCTKWPDEKKTRNQSDQF